MAKEVANKAPTGISVEMLDRLKTGIMESKAATTSSGGKPLLRLIKPASWVYGQRDDAVEDGSIWAVNTLSLQHGWSAWTNHEGATKNSLVGEVMVPIFESKPEQPAPVNNWPFKEQRSFELKCMSGEDEGVEVLWKNSSLGGVDEFNAFIEKVRVHLDDNPAYPCAVIELKSDSYPHQKYGKVITPVFDIVDWSSMDGRLLSEAEGTAIDTMDDEEEDIPLPTPTPARRSPSPQPVGAAASPPTPIRKGRSASAPIAAPAEPEPTARRRPIRR